MRILSPLLVVLILVSCGVPKKPVTFRSIRNMVLEASVDGSPLLHGEAVFYNPNRLRMKLKEVNVEVLVDGVKSASADQKFDFWIPANDEFVVPLEIKLTMKKEGLLGTVLDLLGGKKYEIHYMGYIRVRVHGVTIKVPVDYSNEIKLKI